MLRLVVLLSLLALSLACKPTNGSTNTHAKKREVHQADVFVETKLQFNPALNSIFKNALKEGVEQHADEQQVIYDSDMVYAEMHQIGDKFAMKYSAFDVDCGELHNFIATGKMKTDLIGNVTVNCNGENVL
uniref:Lipoprotein n=1 Tax=Haemonchus contortus TaxID=6289 RepID=A0A7I5E9T1_HAECO